jgi:hypothetical protein
MPSTQSRREKQPPLSNHRHERLSAERDCFANEEDDGRSFSSESLLPGIEREEIPKRVHTEKENAITQEVDDDEDDDDDGNNEIMDGDEKQKMETDDDEYKEGSSHEGDSVRDEDCGRRRISILDRLIEKQTERLGNRNNPAVWDICTHRPSSNVRGGRAMNGRSKREIEESDSEARAVKRLSRYFKTLPDDFFTSPEARM